MDALLGIIGLAYITFKLIVVLFFIGLVIWALAEIGATLFKIFFYGVVTILSSIGLVWLFA